MAKPAGLTLAFLQRQPQAAARVIEEIDAADGAAFLATVPARIGASVVAAMVPWNAARCVERLTDDHAGGLIRAMAYQDGTTILRLVSKDRVGTILEQLPKRLAKNFSTSLTYPKGSVGAWMDHGVPVFTADHTVADALKLLQRGGGRTLQHVFIVDSGRRFAGAVSLGELLHGGPQTPLAEIMDRSVLPLSNRATLLSVTDRPQWDNFTMLPVIGRRKQILGGLTRENLRKGLEEDGSRAPVLNPNSMVGHLLVSYLVVCSGLLHFASQPGGGKP